MSEQDLAESCRCSQRRYSLWRSCTELFRLLSCLGCLNDRMYRSTHALLALGWQSSLRLESFNKPFLLYRGFQNWLLQTVSNGSFWFSHIFAPPQKAISCPSEACPNEGLLWVVLCLARKMSQMKPSPAPKRLMLGANLTLLQQLNSNRDPWTQETQETYLQSSSASNTINATVLHHSRYSCAPANAGICR